MLQKAAKRKVTKNLQNKSIQCQPFEQQLMVWSANVNKQPTKTK